MNQTILHELHKLDRKGLWEVREEVNRQLASKNYMKFVKKPEGYKNESKRSY